MKWDAYIRQRRNEVIAEVQIVKGNQNSDATRILQTIFSKIEFGEVAEMGQVTDLRDHVRGRIEFFQIDVGLQPSQFLGNGGLR